MLKRSYEEARAAAWMCQRLAVPGAWFEPEHMSASLAVAFESLGDVITHWATNNWESVRAPEQMKPYLFAELEHLSEHPANPWRIYAGSGTAARAYLAAGMSLDELRDAHTTNTPLMDVEAAWMLASLNNHAITSL